jgi:hypothetical protein
MLRRMLGSKWGEATKGWRKLHNQELHNLCSLSEVKKKEKVGEWER